MSDVVTDPVEHVLNKHWSMDGFSDEDSTFCRCGVRVQGGPAFHRRHVAVAVYDALGIDGPKPWELGPASPSRDRPDLTDLRLA